MLSTLVYIFTYKGWFFVAGTNMLEDTAANWIFGIAPASFGVVGAAINFAVAYLVSGATEAAGPCPGTGGIDPRAERRRRGHRH